MEHLMSGEEQALMDQVGTAFAIARAAESCWQSGEMDDILDNNHPMANILADLLFDARPDGWL